MKTLFAAILLSAVPAMAADIYDFSVLPQSGAIEGAPGSTIGWGYSIQNESTALWLVTIGMGLDVFQHGTPNVLFDFPTIAPGSSVTVPFDQAGGSGLAELTWDSSAPPGFTNAGTFVLSAEWWNGDPLAGGQLQFPAPDSDQSYSATVVGTPEPATGSILVFSVLLLGFSGSLRHVWRIRARFS